MVSATWKTIGGRYFPGIKLPQPQTWNRIPLKTDGYRCSQKAKPGDSCVRCRWTERWNAFPGFLAAEKLRTPAFEKLTFWSQKWRFGSHAFPFLMGDFHGIHGYVGDFHGIHGYMSGKVFFQMEVETVESVEVRIGPFTKFNRVLVRSYGGRTQLCQIMPRKKGPRPGTDSEWILVV